MGEQANASGARAVPGSARTIAIVLGIVALLAVASMIVFFIVAGPFGLINDALNAMIGILAAVRAAGA